MVTCRYLVFGIVQFSGVLAAAKKSPDRGAREAAAYLYLRVTGGGWTTGVNADVICVVE